MSPHNEIPENTASLINPDVLGIFLTRFCGDLEILRETNQRTKSKR